MYRTNTDCDSVSLNKSSTKSLKQNETIFHTPVTSHWPVIGDDSDNNSRVREMMLSITYDVQSLQSTKTPAKVSDCDATI